MIIDTAKRIESWGCADTCRIRPAEIVDVDIHTHLAFANRRGFYLVPAGYGELPTGQTALKAADRIQTEYCYGAGNDVVGDAPWPVRNCPNMKRCSPENAAVMTASQIWKPALRPKRQRP